MRATAVTARRVATEEAMTREEHKLSFPSHDGRSLFYRFWPALRGRNAQAVVLLHREHEHSGRMQHLVDELQLDAFAYFAWDARGHGCSPGPRGDSPGAACSVKDLDCFVRHIAEHHRIPIENIALIGQGTGALLAALWLHDYAPPIRCAVLAATAFKTKFRIPFGLLGLRLLYWLRGNFLVDTGVDAQHLTHDLARVSVYARDPLITRPISARTLVCFARAARRVVEDAHAIRVPVQVLVSGKDRVVHAAAQRNFYERLGSIDKEIHTFKCFYHDTLGERGRHFALTKVRDFVARRFERNPAALSRGPFDHMAGVDSAHRESQPRSWMRPVRSTTRAALHSLGRLSDGVRMGINTGFESGTMLDYVYRNSASGSTPLGRIVDRWMLDTVRSKSLRARHNHVAQAIRIACRHLGAAGTPIRIVDIDAGHGRGVLDAAQSLPALPDSILLRDTSLTNVAEGIELIRARRMTEVARFVQADPFNAKSLATLAPCTTLAIAAGLYERHPDNAMVERSLAGLSQAVPRGAYFIYSGELGGCGRGSISRVLANPRSSVAPPKRRRTQAELDQLVSRAGFRKVEQWTDEWGVTTVSLAVRT